jgi:hypothetical protein
MVFLAQLLLVAGSVASAASAVALEPRQSSDHVASVDLTVTRGKPEHRASGFIYGIPDNFPNQIPLHWFVAHLCFPLSLDVSPPSRLTATLLTGTLTWALPHAKAAVRS